MTVLQALYSLAAVSRRRLSETEMGGYRGQGRPSSGREMAIKLSKVRIVI